MKRLLHRALKWSLMIIVAVTGGSSASLDGIEAAAKRDEEKWKQAEEKRKQAEQEAERAIALQAARDDATE